MAGIGNQRFQPLPLPPCFHVVFLFILASLMAEGLRQRDRYSNCTRGVTSRLTILSKSSFSG